MNRSFLVLLVFAALVPATARADHSPGHNDTTETQTAEAPLALDGYCPVCPIKIGRWEKGKPEHSSVYDGKRYQFPGASVKAIFDAAPEKYVPSLGGDCIVCWEKYGNRVPGSRKFWTVHQGRLHVFPDKTTRQEFIDDPDRFVDADLVADGNCVVCQATKKKTIPGFAEHTVIHDGLRYQFPNESTLQVFRASPQEFSVDPQAKKRSIAKRKSQTLTKAKATDRVSVTGRSGCAACEFGVLPIGAPDQLGLALVSDDGTVNVIEGAHKSVPKIYEARFDGGKIHVEGKVIRRDGKVAWIEPVAIRSVP